MGREAGIEVRKDSWADFVHKFLFSQVGEMLVPVTAHAAFDKAAELLGMRIR